MPQQGLPFPTSNNAPLPIPGGYGNATGANFGNLGAGGQGTPFPTMTPYGGPAYNTGPYTGTNLGGLNAGLMAYGQGYGTNLYNDLGKAYGKGTGQLLGNLLSGQLYNPQVAAAFLNAQQPGIARGEASVLGAFGDAGARFSSAAALGLGDYESQVQLNQQQTLAQLYENAQQQELSVLQGVLPTLQQEQANKGSWIDDVIGGLEMVGGVAVDAVTAGTLGNPLIAAGAGQLMGHGGGGRGGAPMIPGMTGLPGYGGNTGIFGGNAPSYIPNYNPNMLPDTQVQPSSSLMMNLPQSMQYSGGQLFGGGYDPYQYSGDVPIPFY